MDFAESLRGVIKEIVREELASRKPEPAAEMLSTFEAGQRVRVTERTIRRWVRDGRLSSVKAGRVLRIDATELDKLVWRDGRIRSTANGGQLKNGNQATRDLTPEELATRDFGR